MVLASLLFATMGVCVKLASAHYSIGEIVFYRGMTGATMLLAFSRWQRLSLRTAVPGLHFARSASGVLALCLWFYTIGKLPLATAMTLNYMSSVWMALFLMGGAVMLGTGRFDWRLLATVLLGFGGVALVLRPTMDPQQVWAGVLGLLSGVLSATAYLQVTSLGRIGEPESRIVFYFSLGGIAAGLGISLWTGWSAHTLPGVLLLAGVGLTATTAQLMMTRAYATGNALVNASLQYLGIAFSFAYGVLLFDDPVTLITVAGVVLIVGAGLGATLLRNRAAPDTVSPSAD